MVGVWARVAGALLAALVAGCGGPSVQDRVDELRMLEQGGRWAELIAVLDAGYVQVPAGWSSMGSDTGLSNERPQRLVYLDAYRIGRYEVTNLQYAAFVASEGVRPPAHWLGDSFPDDAASHPVVGVSWKEADAYCRWAGMRLPTEAEWERACRGPGGFEYPWGNEWQPSAANVSLAPLADPDDAWAWLSPDAGGPATLHRVGEPAAGASTYGVCNLAGNAAEWVADWYAPDAYGRLPSVNPIGVAPEWDHSIRGGAWLFRHADTELLAQQSRCGFRNASHSADDPRVGFRCAIDG